MWSPCGRLSTTRRGSACCVCCRQFLLSARSWKTTSCRSPIYRSSCPSRREPAARHPGRRSVVSTRRSTTRGSPPPMLSAPARSRGDGTRSGRTSTPSDPRRWTSTCCASSWPRSRPLRIASYATIARSRTSPRSSRGASRPKGPPSPRRRPPPRPRWPTCAWCTAAASSKQRPPSRRRSDAGTPSSESATSPRRSAPSGSEKARFCSAHAQRPEAR
mmetsp:Transcript_109454/g.316394  ORF Transcript_109454/g.316394 Transcript_109454/m.316394 type:complete len:217 (-) Transcript_109454:426-1076(-)